MRNKVKEKKTGEKKKAITKPQVIVARILKEER